MKILFICTHNRCRSILAEAITKKISDGAIEVKSAGSSATGNVHELTLENLTRHGYDTQDLCSTSWLEKRIEKLNEYDLDALSNADIKTVFIELEKIN